MPDTPKSNDAVAPAKDAKPGKAKAMQARPFAPKTPKFDGKVDDRKGFIYDCADARQSDQFVKTTKEIAKYVGRTSKPGGGDTRLAIQNLRVPTFVIPADPPANTTRSELRIHDKLPDEHVKRLIHLNDNLNTLLFSLVWGQCSDIMRAKVEALDNFAEIETGGDISCVLEEQLLPVPKLDVGFPLLA